MMDSPLTEFSLFYLSEKWQPNRTLSKEHLKEINTHTFTYVAIYIATTCVAKLAVDDPYALVRGVRFKRTPVTIRGRIAVQPVAGSVRCFRYWLVKPNPAWPVTNDVAIIHKKVTPQTCKFQNQVGETNSARKIKQIVTISLVVSDLIFTTLLCFKCIRGMRMLSFFLLFSSTGCG